MTARKQPPVTFEQLRSFTVAIPFSGCWVWLDRSVMPTGYGQIWSEGKRWSAHRLAYTLAKGSIPEGLDLDHLCRVRCCVNPDHLEPVTRQVNLARGNGAELSRARMLAVTECPSGHPYSEENTYKRLRGDRMCLICHRDQSARSARKARAKASGAREIDALFA